MFLLQIIFLLNYIICINSELYSTEYSLIGEQKFVSSISAIPHHVLVVYNNLYCSGSLIRSKIVLTTASCLMAGPRNKTFVKVGANSITGLGQVIPVVDIKIHEYFRYYSRIDNDIAMLFLKDNVIFADYAKKILLVEPEMAIGPGFIIDVSGWGSQGLPQKYAYLLLSTQMVILEREVCLQIYKQLMTASNFCAKFEPGRRLSDIGGSATYKQNLVGILSHSSPTEFKQNVAIISNITYFYKWIMLNTKRFIEKYCLPDDEFLEDNSELSN